MTNQQITTITFIEVKGWKAYRFITKFPLIRNELREIQGVEFVKLLGTGNKKGFGKLINFNTFVALITWKSEKDADNFFEESDSNPILEQYSKEIWTLYFKNIKSKGLWNTINPFRDFEAYKSGPIAVITRAQINFKSLFSFWKSVPKVSEQLEHQEGLIFATGIGEYPYFMQATFSLWDNVEAVQKYAYQNKFHQKAIIRTHKEDWYSEELFAHFLPYKGNGNWKNSVEIEDKIFRNNGNSLNHKLKL